MIHIHGRPGFNVSLSSNGNSSIGRPDVWMLLDVVARQRSSVIGRDVTSRRYGPYGRRGCAVCFTKTPLPALTPRGMAPHVSLVSLHPHQPRQSQWCLAGHTPTTRSGLALGVLPCVASTGSPSKLLPATPPRGPPSPPIGSLCSRAPSTTSQMWVPRARLLPPSAVAVAAGRWLQVAAIAASCACLWAPAAPAPALRACGCWFAVVVALALLKLRCCVRVAVVACVTVPVVCFMFSNTCMPSACTAPCTVTTLRELS